MTGYDKKMVALGATVILVVISFWGSAAYVAVHFIRKFW